MRSPKPIMLICESFKRRESEGNIMENMRPKRSFFTAGFCSFLMTLSPQKVKNIDTFLPVAAAPLANTKVASARSRLSLNMISVLLPGNAGAATVDRGAPEPFSMTTVWYPPSDFTLTTRLPVLPHHACASRGKPASVAFTSTQAPACMPSMAFFSFMIGPGHCSPQASILSVSITSAS